MQDFKNPAMVPGSSFEGFVRPNVLFGPFSTPNGRSFHPFSRLP
jgi:hypothetical protein